VADDASGHQDQAAFLFGESAVSVAENGNDASVVPSHRSGVMKLGYWNGVLARASVAVRAVPSHWSNWSKPGIWINEPAVADSKEFCGLRISCVIFG
jgi:hypothetical protein